MKTKVIACSVIKEELLALPESHGMDYEFISMGLHYHPDKLREEIKLAIKNSRDFDQLIIGFGLCGQALDGIQASSCPIVIPRIHDCIPILMGSFNEYRQVNVDTPGTYYMSGGWLEGERSIWSEHQRVVGKFGEKRAVKVLKMIFESYRQINFINTSHPRVEEWRIIAKDLAQLLGLNYCESRGKEKYLKRLLTGPWDNEHFIIIKPGSMIQSKDFSTLA